MADKHFGYILLETPGLDGISVIKGTKNEDQRGMIYSSYHWDFFNRLLPKKIVFCHDKFSISNKGVLRGLHGDKKTWKLVSCISGEIYQVVVDCRPQSDTYLQWRSWYLRQDEPVFILIPPLFANGFCAMEKNSIYHYKLAYEGDYNDFDQQFVIKWNDPKINIEWPITHPILNARDQ